MSIPTTSRASRIAHTVTKVWTELDYAQRRLFEIRTGAELTRREPPPIPIDELKALHNYKEPA